MLFLDDLMGYMDVNRHPVIFCSSTSRTPLALLDRNIR